MFRENNVDCIPIPYLKYTIFLCKNCLPHSQYLVEYLLLSRNINKNNITYVELLKYFASCSSSVNSASSMGVLKSYGVMLLKSGSLST